MQEVAKRVLKVAPSSANVLIFGESGTGKELIAKSIHSSSKRKDKPFIPLDCVALPPTLMESEFFGYEQGAFTGAVKSKPGVIEIAHEGSLFLDEITELELNLQAKLLRFIQERQFRRLGGRQLKQVDVRIISATNWNPEDAVRENHLRQDLYYRLNVVPIYIPPLRERKEDIPLLVRHFLSKYQQSTQREISGISKEALNQLKKYSWPGNVRELQNVIEQATSLAESHVIEVHDLPDQIRMNQMTYEHGVYNKMNFKEAKEQQLKNFSKQYFKDLLKSCNGNISQAARIAGISRRTIYRLLQDFDVQTFKEK
jgi:transcriptional regulator with PAS, ATPase and Fis domain